MDWWWEPLYSQLRMQLCLTPLARDAGADLQLLYPAATTEDDKEGGEGRGERETPYVGVGAEAGEGVASWGWGALRGPECLPGGWGSGLGLPWGPWPDPDPATCSVSPLSGGPRDYLRVAGPGVYVGCAYREGPGSGEYREENFVYFVIARKYDSGGGGEERRGV